MSTCILENCELQEQITEYEVTNKINEQEDIKTAKEMEVNVSMLKNRNMIRKQMFYDQFVRLAATTPQSYNKLVSRGNNLNNKAATQVLTTRTKQILCGS